MSIPFIGVYLAVILGAVRTYTTKLEDVADFLAEDFEKGRGGSEFVGRCVGIRQREKSG